MIYPKPQMSITEMTRLGFSRTDLYAASKHTLAYHYITYSCGGGKIKFDTAEFEKYRKNVMAKR